MKKNYYQSPQIKYEVVTLENLMVGGSKNVTIDPKAQEQWNDGGTITGEFNWDEEATNI